MFFSSDVGFSMSACSVRSVDVTESLVEPLRFMELLRRHSAGRIEPSFRQSLAPMGMSCNKP